MAEIKSTLDIIMEKAKKFSVTEEEKKGFRRQELEGKIKGLVQKALDGVLDYGRFQTEVVALQGKEKDLVDQILQNEVVARLEVEANSEPLLKILESAAGSARGAVKKTLTDFDLKAEKQKDSRRKALLESFRKKGISGSAVLSNLGADPEWFRAKSDLKRQLQAEIRKVIEKGG